MNKYIIVTTLCNNEEISNKIIDTLLQKKLVAEISSYEIISANRDFFKMD